MIWIKCVLSFALGFYVGHWFGVTDAINECLRLLSRRHDHD